MTCRQRYGSVGESRVTVNRLKTERNQKIWDYWQRGYRQSSIAKMFKMTEGAVYMVIRRKRNE